MTRQDERENLTVNDAHPHVANIGSMIEVRWPYHNIGMPRCGVDRVSALPAHGLPTRKEPGPASLSARVRVTQTAR